MFSNLLKSSLEIECPQIEDQLINGFMICSNSNNIKSTCQFKCNNGFLLEGKEYVTCILDNEDGRWSDTLSSCRGKRNTLIVFHIHIESKF